MFKEQLNQYQEDGFSKDEAGTLLEVIGYAALSTDEGIKSQLLELHENQEPGFDFEAVRKERLRLSELDRSFQRQRAEAILAEANELRDLASQVLMAGGE